MICRSLHGRHGVTSLPSSPPRWWACGGSSDAEPVDEHFFSRLVVIVVVVVVVVCACFSCWLALWWFLCDFLSADFRVSFAGFHAILWPRCSLVRCLVVRMCWLVGVLWLLSLVTGSVVGDRWFLSIDAFCPNFFVYQCAAVSHVRGFMLWLVSWSRWWTKANLHVNGQIWALCFAQTYRYTFDVRNVWVLLRVMTCLLMVCKMISVRGFSARHVGL